MIVVVIENKTLDTGPQVFGPFDTEEDATTWLFANADRYGGTEQTDVVDLSVAVVGDPSAPVLTLVTEYAPTITVERQRTVHLPGRCPQSGMDDPTSREIARITCDACKQRAPHAAWDGGW